MTVVAPFKGPRYVMRTSRHCSSVWWGSQSSAHSCCKGWGNVGYYRRASVGCASGEVTGDSSRRLHRGSRCGGACGGGGGGRPVGGASDAGGEGWPGRGGAPQLPRGGRDVCDHWQGAAGAGSICEGGGVAVGPPELPQGRCDG